MHESHHKPVEIHTRRLCSRFFKLISRLRPRRRFDAVLDFPDSGKGMSEEYQRNHLFRHFSQEDTLSNRLGIGMHIVSRMVQAVGGKIEVSSSQKGTGTRVVVTAPLEHRGGPDVVQGTATYPRLAGLKSGLLSGKQQQPATRQGVLVAVAWEMIIAALRKYLDHLNCDIQEFSIDEMGAAFDLVIATELDWEACLSSIEDKGAVHNDTESPPMVIICNNALTA